MNNSDKTGEVTKSVSKTDKKPNENAGFYFSTHIKITDPKTNQVLVEKRGDN